MSTTAGAQCLDFLNVSKEKLNSDEQINLCELTQGKTVLIVNTASKCGFTPQFTELEQLHQKYKEQGLVVLGFPSDDFFQENKEEEDTAKVCYINYGVTFNMFAPVSVRGKNADPIFQHLAKQSASPKWNFYKYLVSADGREVKHFTSTTKPSSDSFQQALKSMLK
ncbi:MULTISPECIES: glutathione peroxidase [unclassified Motilimonas]|uniref:glutathione peroxidase n=1 Tax=Motilimonas TaxID=1914248 RepID=UPI001E5665A9|nr:MULTISPECIES: glutathione peroxidase [unclassified Motilimonas]MCE0557749.1 glutathione peroxidase [Motilimonas sp. E26]MDO6525940.1 glutathione peroxidase [Motilimonas sp. 1_MG-2023]